jgi:cysteine desulfurase
MPQDDPIYLDFNATTPVADAVVEAMLPYLRTHFGNPSSGHVYGRRARLAVETARAQVAALIGAEPEEILFTGSGTEANNLLILGLADRLSPGPVACSTIEHPAVLKPLQALGRRTWTVTLLPVDQGGRVELDGVADRLVPGIRLVSVMHSNNEVGTLQPVGALARLAHAKGAVMHSDAAQSIGKVPVDVGELEVDALTIVGHKFYAPKGIGALYVRKGTPLSPILFGGGQERGLRPGTENVALIVALGAAAVLAQERLAADQAHLQQLRDRLAAALHQGVPGLLRNGDADQALPHCLNVSFPGVRGSAVLAVAGGIAASTGSACHEGGETPSEVLLAMGCEPIRALGAVRLSVGRPTTTALVDQAAAQLIAAWRQLAGRQ